ncbi:FAD-dependent oxidoreductase [Polynucleobacter sp. AP-Elch-400A-B2]|uniref:NAD(P)/FAD-dependent oxidoreductase n=1 Tax=Polynucleobacter sp. AP-Elch-400A-B2 TaxID=2576930 RepID=UPI00203D147D|nr:FAD-dependent oxidoreductase [Polynucleobacter sp. AP-Elch-400A-B2]QWE23944.1 FAD-dependent oxidoreductase [Polynucleobacter sp. AP-Elch-400A-B2]
MDHQNQSSSLGIVIIGSGLAGYTVIRELRKIDKEIPITLVTREPGYFYSKPMLSTALASSKSAEQLVSTNAESMATQLDITILGDADVTAIDTGAQTVATSKGNISYGKLVLGLGADQIRLALEGNAANEVITVNDLEDYAQFRKTIEGKKRIAILGAGLIGCEFANDLVLGSYEVEVIDLAPQALGRLLPEAAAQALQAKLSAAGVRWHFATTVQSIDRNGDSLSITLANGSAIHSDAFLSAVGLRPRLDLAQSAGIATGVGITVNRQLETSAKNVYAIGDCAEVEGLVLPYVMPIMQAARALAPNLLGQATVLNYPAMPVMVKTPALPTIVSPPAKGAVGDWKINSVEGGLEARFESSDGKLLGFALMGTATAQRGALTKDLPPIL